MTDKFLPFTDSFRFITAQGFDHMVTIHAESYVELLSRIGEAEADILAAGGKPLISNNLSVSGAAKLEKTTAPADAPAPAGDPNEPRYVDAAELELKDGQHVFPIKEVFRDKNGKGDKYMLKVVLDSPYEHGNGNWGISYFKTDGVYAGWTKWELGKRFAPRDSATRVIVEDPQPGSKFANIVGFLP